MTEETAVKLIEIAANYALEMTKTGKIKGYIEPIDLLKNYHDAILEQYHASYKAPPESQPVNK